jgi:microcystin-dependent protein
MSSVSRKYAHYNAHERPTVGDMKMSGVDVDHLGWLLCDGRELSVSTYYYLHQVIGYSFGGSDLSFNLPNASGRVPGMIGQSVGRTWVMGDLSGQETHTLVIAEMPAHNHGTNASNTQIGNGLTGISGEHAHTATDSGHEHSYVNQVGDQSVNTLTTQDTAADQVDYNQTTGTGYANITVAPNGLHQHTIATQGGSQPHNNMQPTIFVGNMFIYCGKNYIGTFPSTRGQIVF